ncbi:hypothetical protein GW17_00059222 [Ensete ventricosum]|nr:hypothetical protein GW17_00059222 [Ensete ventricosum]
MQGWGEGSDGNITAEGSTRRRREGESSVSVVAVTHPSPNRRKKKPPAAICSAKQRPLSFPLPSTPLFSYPSPSSPSPAQPTDETISAVHSPWSTRCGPADRIVPQGTDPSREIEGPTRGAVHRGVLLTCQRK